MKDKVEISPVIQTVQNNVLFQDFLIFLRLLEKRPLELTRTGNLKIKEIKTLGKLFKHDIYFRDKQGKIMFQPRREDEFRYILLIRQIAHVMNLVYKRKSKLYFSKNGKEYLNNIDEKTQYKQTVLWYFHRANWAYLHPKEEVVEKLQRNQKEIWSYLLRKEEWINFRKFSEGLSFIYKLSVKDIHGQEMPDSVHWAIESVLINNLEQFGLVKIKKKIDQYGINEIYSFRLTPTGKVILQEALEPF